MKVLIIADTKKSLAKFDIVWQQLSNPIDDISRIDNLNDAETYLKDENDVDLIFNICGDVISDFFSFYQKNQLKASLVFISNSAKHIETSFLFNTLHFIHGVYDVTDIKFCLDKYTTYHKQQQDLAYIQDLQKLTKLLSNREKSYKKRFMVKVGNVIKSVNVEDIAYFFSQDRINYLVKYNRKKFPVDNTLDEIEEMLDPDSFFRANRQFIINIDCIAEIHPYFKGRVKLNLEPPQDGDLIISADKSRLFKDWLDE